MGLIILRWLAFIEGTACLVNGVFVAVRTYELDGKMYWFGLILSSVSIAVGINNIYMFFV